MKLPLGSRLLQLSVLFLSGTFCYVAHAQPPLNGHSVAASHWRRLVGNTRPEARARNDRGAVPNDLPMEHMLLQLTRSAADEQALEEYIDSLNDPASPNYHHWLTAREFGAAWGVAPAERDTVVSWLESHGFTVNSITPSGMTIDFSGTAAQVRQAFHTQIDYLDVGGIRHIANMSNPEVPAGLASHVAGIVSLHDFSPRRHSVTRPDYTFTAQGGTYQAVTPGDLAVIYDLTPLFDAGITGEGQTIAVIEDSDLYTAADWTTFRAAFGLTKYTSGRLTEVHPAPASGANDCSAPGVVAGDDGEAAVDAEWASAAAPGAAIEVAACASTRTTFGGFIALQNLVNSEAPPSIVSISYGECEAENGATANAFINGIYQQAAAEGISVFVAAGDEGAASCDAGARGATHGIGVSAFASTPYNVAVGGTDFGDTIQGTNSTYWSNINSGTFATALSYVPEIPWDDSCASPILAAAMGYSTVYGPGGFCSSAAAVWGGNLAVAAGSGGPSGCATGSPALRGVVSGTCTGYAKPSWQDGVLGIPSDGVRDIPDISLFAGDGVWGHYFVDCWSDPRHGGSPCSGAPSTWDGGGGTSYSTAILAGIQALVNQEYGPQGNPNPTYYRLAAGCNASTNSDQQCSSIFHTVTAGSIDVNCGGTTACFGATQNVFGGGWRQRYFGFGLRISYNGALSTSSTSFTPAYEAGSGWNFATGLGSIDAYNLVTYWNQ